MGATVENGAAAGGMGPALPAQPQNTGGDSGSGQVKECYRLCLNPKMNPGCSVAISSSFAETGASPQTGSDWALDNDANCLANCVRVCVNVHSMVQLQMQ